MNDPNPDDFEDFKGRAKPFLQHVKNYEKENNTDFRDMISFLSACLMYYVGGSIEKEYRERVINTVSSTMIYHLKDLD